jgi:hypothetical protein
MVTILLRLGVEVRCRHADGAGIARPRRQVTFRRSAVVACRLLACLMLMAAPCASAADDLWKLLEAGGRVVLMRHTITTPGAGDPPGMRLDDCSTQRNLTEEGRRHARAIGEAFRSRRIDVDRVLSSPWCRCLETARLAFSRAEVYEPLSNLSSWKAVWRSQR